MNKGFSRYGNNRDKYKGGGVGRAQELPDVAKAVEMSIDKEFLDAVESFARHFKASNTQVRNIFSAVKQMQMSDFSKEKLLMLRPRLAYAATRESSVIPLKNVLSAAINKVVETQDEKIQKERFERFCLCCEAILAYTKR